MVRSHTVARARTSRWQTQGRGSSEQPYICDGFLRLLRRALRVPLDRRFSVLLKSHLLKSVARDEPLGHQKIKAADKRAHSVEERMRAGVGRDDLIAAPTSASSPQRESAGLSVNARTRRVIDAKPQARGTAAADGCTRNFSAAQLSRSGRHHDSTTAAFPIASTAAGREALAAVPDRRYSPPLRARKAPRRFRNGAYSESLESCLRMRAARMYRWLQRGGHESTRSGRDATWK